MKKISITLQEPMSTLGLISLFYTRADLSGQIPSKQKPCFSTLTHLDDNAQLEWRSDLSMNQPKGVATE